jgi:hypothetical protein
MAGRGKTIVGGGTSHHTWKNDKLWHECRVDNPLHRNYKRNFLKSQVRKLSGCSLKNKQLTSSENKS